MTKKLLDANIKNFFKKSNWVIPLYLKNFKNNFITDQSGNDQCTLWKDWNTPSINAMDFF
jgi:hypothetical protein